MRLEPRQDVGLVLLVAAPAGAIVAALVLAAIPLAFAQVSLLDAYRLMATGALGGQFAITETLTRATPLILTGLAVTAAFRARLWNIGAEGQLYAGAMAAVLVASHAWIDSSLVMIAVMLLTGAAAGALLLIVPTLLKTRLGVDEVVTTLLLNFVVLLFVSMMLEGPLQDPMSMGWPQSEPIAAIAELPDLIARTRLHVGFILALIAALALWLVINRTRWGFEMRAVGANVDAARFAGMPVGRVMLLTAVLSGGLAGLAGVGEVAGVRGYLALDLSPGFGYTGIVVAMLAQLNPLGVVASAIFIAAIFVGADSMGRALGVSSYIADLVVAFALLAMLVAGLVTRYRLRRG